MTKMEPPLDLKLRTKDFALRIIKMDVALPKRIEAQVIGKQVLRSETYVGANSREADSSRSRAEFIAKMGDSLKELSETSYWLKLLSETELIKSQRLQPLLIETQELTAIFASIIKKPRSAKPLNY